MEPNGKGGSGAAQIVADLRDRSRQRGTAAMLERHLSAIPLDDSETWLPIVEALTEGAKCKTDQRGAARCASVLAQLRAQNIAIAQHLDKNDRLDEGSPTENLAHTFTATFDKQG